LCETTGWILGEAMPYGELIEQILLICFAYVSGVSQASTGRHRARIRSARRRARAPTGRIAGSRPGAMTASKQARALSNSVLSLSTADSNKAA
jgi:hypothetical protein